MGWLKLREYGMKDSHIRKLMNEFDSFEELYNAENFSLFNDKIKNTLDKANKINLDKTYDFYNSKGVKIITKDCNEYPNGLKKLIDYPIFLYAKGKLLNNQNISEIYEKSIGVVGTRRITKYGKVSCEKIVKELLEYDVTILSGLAEGIDTVALDVAAQKDGNMIAVVGTGIDVVYPQTNKHLWDKVIENGIIFSEYPLGTEPQKWNFPMRNRIISGISSGILIVESYKKGGSLITAELAYNYGKDVFAVPGFINFPSFEGCNELIKENKAKLVVSGEDIIKDFFWDRKKYSSKIEKLDFYELQIVNKLEEETNLDTLINSLSNEMDANKILSTLMILKIKGIIVETGVSKYIKII